MRLRTLLFLVLLLPGVVLGPGWSLRFCAEELLGRRGCCSEVARTSCCPDDERTPLEPQAGIASSCHHCCIDVATLDEQPVPTPEALANVLERAQATALAIAVPSHGSPLVELVREDFDWSGAQAPPAPPGRCTPLPLRI